MHLVKVAADSIDTKSMPILTVTLACLISRKNSQTSRFEEQEKHYEEAVSKILVDSQEMGLNVFIHYIRRKKDYRLRSL